ncbi:MAG TPA: arginase family protein [Gaiellaceae bacterium]|jgi:arginase|nr:arginase family protein [Gaiellaceae bacterium]
MSGLRLIQVPYHLGRENVVLGAGPAPLAEAIGGESVVVERKDPPYNEIYATFDVVRQLAAAVRETVTDERFPLVLAGNCHSAMGTVAGLDRELGVVWFDAHGDFHTPDSSPTGFIDGMALALVTGEGWAELRRSVDGLRRVPEEHVVLVGARDLEPTEEERLAASAVTRADTASLERALGELAERVDEVYVHIDLDVLDPTAGKANDWAVDGGLTASELDEALASILARFDVPAAAFTAYDPRFDPEGRVPQIAATLARRLAPEAVAP